MLVPALGIALMLSVTTSLAQATVAQTAPALGEYPGENLVPTGGIDRYVDSVLEVYRDADGAFLGSWRPDSVLGQMTPNGLISVKGEDADGVVSYTVYRVRLTDSR